MKKQTGARPPMFYAPNTLASKAGEKVGLSPEEAHHALHVLRLKENDPIRLFDGNGMLCEARLGKVSRHSVEAVCGSWVASQTETQTSVILALAHAKAQRTDWLVQKATEMGVSEFHFFAAGHSEVRAIPRDLERWERIAVAACKQSGRARLPRFGQWASLEEMMAAIPVGHARYVFHEAASAGSRAEPIHKGNAWAVIGPEGGFLPEEIEKMTACGFATRSLGPRVLRFETAALCAAAILLHINGELG